VVWTRIVSLEFLRYRHDFSMLGFSWVGRIVIQKKGWRNEGQMKMCLVVGWLGCLNVGGKYWGVMENLSWMFLKLFQ